jgi:hypothetical protein
MITTKNLEIYYHHVNKANDEFRSTVQLADEKLQAENDVHLNFPIVIHGDSHMAWWNYEPINPEDNDDNGEFFLFNDIIVGLYVTTMDSSKEGHQKSYLTTFLSNYVGENKIELARYNLAGELDLAKITNDISKTVATIRDLEMFISNMDPQRGEIVMGLLSDLFYR